MEQEKEVQACWEWAGAGDTGVNSACVLGTGAWSHAHSCTPFLACLQGQESNNARVSSMPSPRTGPPMPVFPGGGGGGDQGCLEKQLPPSGAAAQDTPGTRGKGHPRVTGTRGKEPLTGPIWDNASTTVIRSRN